MIMKVPITGVITNFDPNKAKLDGIGVSGNPNDPVRLIEIDLGNVSWKLLALDLETDEALIEVTPSSTFYEDTGRIDAEGKHIFVVKNATPQDKQKFLDDAEAKVKGKTKDQLYSESGSKRLVKQQHVKGYKKWKESVGVDGGYPNV